MCLFIDLYHVRLGYIWYIGFPNVYGTACRGSVWVRPPADIRHRREKSPPPFLIYFKIKRGGGYNAQEVLCKEAMINC